MITGNTGVVSGELNVLPGLSIGDIAVGDTAIITFRVSINDIPTPNPFENIIDITYTDPTGTKTEPVSGGILDVAGAIGANLSTAIKDADTTTVKVTDVINYTITIPNTGILDAEQVLVLDELIPELALVPGSVVVNGASGPLVGDLTIAPGLNIGTILVGETAVVTFNVVVNAIPTHPEVVNEATISYTDSDGKDGITMTPPATTAIAPKDGGNLGNSTKTANKATALVGDEITYTVTLVNTGDSSADNVFVQDIVGAGVAFVAGSVTIEGTPFPALNPIAGFTIVSIAAGQSVVITYRLTVLAGAPDDIVDQISVIFDTETDPALPPVQRTAQTNPVSLSFTNINLDFVKSVSKDIVAVGDVLTYTLTATNSGDIDLTDVIIKDLLEEDLDFVSGSVKVDGILKPDADIITGFSIGGLLAGESKIITFEVKVIKKVTQYATNQATAVFFFKLTPMGQTRTMTVDSNIVAVLIENPHLLITKVANVQSASLDSIITYQVTMINTGDTILYNVVFKDELPASVELIEGSFTLNGVVVNAVDLAVGVNIGDLNLGEQASIIYSVKVVSGSCDGSIDNAAYATFDYVLRDQQTGKGQTEKVTSGVDANITNFKQIVINSKVCIPKAKPDVEELDDATAELAIHDYYVVETVAGISNEGQRLSSYKLIIHGELNISVEYTALCEDQALHSAEWSIPFTTFIILPADYDPDMTIDVSGIIENVDATVSCLRDVDLNVFVLVIANIK